MGEDIRKEQASVRSFRVTDDVLMKFKGVMEEMGLTQDGALKMLVESYEFEKAKNAIPDRETEIANFQTKASELVEAFLHSLQINQDAEARIRSGFELQLKSKDETIITLQKRITTLEELSSTANTAAAEAENKAKLSEEAAKEANEKMKVAQEAAKDKERLYDRVLKDLEIAETKVEEYETLKASESSLKAELATAKQTIKDDQRDAERSVFLAEQKKDKEISELEKKLSKAEAEIESVEKQNSKLEAKNESLQELVSSLKAEKAEMITELKFLRAASKKVEETPTDRQKI